MAALPLYFDTQFYTSAGVPAALHLLYTYESGTTTPLETYTDATGDTANANPITLDSAGRANLWIGNRVYALELKTPAGVLVKRWDGVGTDPSWQSTTDDYATTAAAIAAAIAGDFVVGVLDDLTVSIPNDAATLQIAVDRLTPLNKQATITLHIATGHALTAGLSISGRDCGQFRITSVDAAVNLAAAFGSTVFEATNGSTLPRLACLIDASNQTAGNGVSLDNATATIESGCGVRDVYGTGLLMVSNSYAMADGSVWTGAARNGATGAGITSWGSRCSAEGADVSNSGYYGAQAAHGGALSFREGVANDCYRHGIRATDAAIVDADSASANDCAVDTLGYSVYAYQAGVVNFTSGSATGNLGTAALLAYGAGSAINASEATVTGATAVGVKVERGGLISVVSATVSGSGDADYMNDGTGKIVRVAEFDCGAPAETQSLTIAGGDVAFIPHPSGTTFILLSNEAAAASDNLDTVTPATGYTIKQGHRLILATVSGAEDPTIRDVATSGAAGNYAFQTASGTSVTLANTAQLAEFIWRGTFWAMLSYSAN